MEKNKKQKMSIPKKVTLSIMAILMAGMSLICLWWIFIYFFGPEKNINKSFNWDYIATTGSDKQQVLRIKYNSNKNNNGLEMFEMDWTYFQDEEKNNTYSQGLQYVASTPADKIDFSFKIDSDKDIQKVGSSYHFPLTYNVYNGWGGYKVNSETTEYYNYMSSNNYETTTRSTNPLTLDSKLKIELGGDSENVYLITPKGLNSPQTVVEKETATALDLFTAGIFDYYCYYDYNYLAKILYDSVKGLPGGTKSFIEFEFGDYFDYYKYDPQTHSYGERLTENELAQGKVIQEIKSYCVAYIEVSDNGASSYNDSLFKMIKNESKFTLDPDRPTKDYFTGRNVVNVDNNDFDYVKVYDNYIALKLKDDFVKKYLKFKNDIALNIEIDLNKINDLGFEFFGFTKDSGLNQFEIKSIFTVKDQIKSEVNL